MVLATGSEIVFSLHLLLCPPRRLQSGAMKVCGFLSQDMAWKKEHGGYSHFVHKCPSFPPRSVSGYDPLVWSTDKGFNWPIETKQWTMKTAGPEHHSHLWCIIHVGSHQIFHLFAKERALIPKVKKFLMPPCYFRSYITYIQYWILYRIRDE